MRTVYKSVAGVVTSAGLMHVMPMQFAFSQAVELVVVNVKAVARGYRTSKLKGTNVTNDKNEKIGEIDDIIIGRDKVLFAILQVGGSSGWALTSFQFLTSRW
jgi:hypothetical protein